MLVWLLSGRKGKKEEKEAKLSLCLGIMVEKKGMFKNVVSNHFKNEG